MISNFPAKIAAQKITQTFISKFSTELETTKEWK